MTTAWADLTIVCASPDAHRRQHDVSQLRPVHRPDRHVEGDPVRSVESIWQKADIGGIGFTDAAAPCPEMRGKVVPLHLKSVQLRQNPIKLFRVSDLVRHVQKAEKTTPHFRVRLVRLHLPECRIVVSVTGADFTGTDAKLGRLASGAGSQVFQCSRGWPNKARAEQSDWLPIACVHVFQRH